MKTKLCKVWNGRELRETVNFKNETYLIVTGLKNGGDSNCVYHWSKSNGWNIFITNTDVGFSSETSYVSEENRRKKYAEELNEELKKGIIQIFG